MIYIFLIAYIIFIIPVFLTKNISKKTRFLLCIFFILFIFIFRDPSAASDYKNYLKAASINNMDIGAWKAYSPLFYYLNSFFLEF